MTSTNNLEYHNPTLPERIFNRLFGLLVRLGLGLRHNYLVEVPGRKSGRRYATPVDLLEFEGRRYLVCPRGRAQWVRNAEAAGRVTLIKGTKRAEYVIEAVPVARRPPLLKAYLDRFSLTVQRYFPVRADSPVGEFAGIAVRYPVFELKAASK